eukprot:CAMPEP_0205805244 /NCGR_PEP_ID=MMETSP0205-20121125/8411_1 /ASSEMBLY_ACC=CAM_ASM_000278 /TAXON_ID=36767 /ORGANISM="Euplotes focardii, Strain TN1" /LENGTH=183 /DNA_ID=CAMNT_0053076155 /DNA_START=90 /DNA_END=638 /DNA_ORIENTATION=+
MKSHLKAYIAVMNEKDLIQKHISKAKKRKNILENELENSVEIIKKDEEKWKEVEDKAKIEMEEIKVKWGEKMEEFDKDNDVLMDLEGREKEKRRRIMKIWEDVEILRIEIKEKKERRFGLFADHEKVKDELNLVNKEVDKMYEFGNQVDKFLKRKPRKKIKNKSKQINSKKLASSLKPKSKKE